MVRKLLMRKWKLLMITGALCVIIAAGVVLAEVITSIYTKSTVDSGGTPKTTVNAETEAHYSYDCGKVSFLCQTTALHNGVVVDSLGRTGCDSGRTHFHKTVSVTDSRMTPVLTLHNSYASHTSTIWNFYDPGNDNCSANDVSNDSRATDCL